jgi:hypothetical protein
LRADLVAKNVLNECRLGLILSTISNNYIQKEKKEELCEKISRFDVLQINPKQQNST